MLNTVKNDTDTFLFESASFSTLRLQTSLQIYLKDLLCEKKTDRQTDSKQTDRQTDRQTGRQVHTSYSDNKRDQNHATKLPFAQTLNTTCLHIVTVI